MSQHSGTGSGRPWDLVVQEAETEHRAWLQTLEQKIAEHGIEVIIQRFRDDEVNADELFHSLIIAREYPEEFVALACEMILSRQGSVVAREFLKKSGDPAGVPALRLLLESVETSNVYWALDALKGIRCEASIEAVRSFENRAAPHHPDDPWGHNFLEDHRQETLDVLQGNEKPHEERLRDEILDAIRERGAEAVVHETAEGKYPSDEIFIALRELGEFPVSGISLAMKLATNAQLTCHERRDPIYFLCEYRGEDAEALLFEALGAQLDIHFSGGDAWAEGCCLMDAIGAAGSEAAIARLEAIDLARSGASNASTVDLEADRQGAMQSLRARFAPGDS